uniref:NFACT RNA-binding domain-containing protein n=1 Tax=Megaviridae environmental sample TaxID=1737588 RepID=A0A5J6VK66_9VIRU|nr:MAG: protein of unknown function DUF814 [Megaviridae environmental sample]
MKFFTKTVDDKDYIFKLGQNAKENHLIIDSSEPDDWWFHLDNYPSGHCIIESNEVDRELILYAATLVAEHSKYRNNKKLKIIYTQIKNIKKTKTCGEVKILSEKGVNSILVKK